MATRSWLSRMRDDEEMAKKDDDLTQPRSSRRPEQWRTAHAHSSRRYGMKRYVAYAAIVLTVLFYVRGSFGSSSSGSLSGKPSPTRYMPQYHSKSEDVRREILSKARVDVVPEQSRDKPEAKTDKKSTEATGSNSEAKSNKPEETSPQTWTYNGPLRFPALGSSLRSIGVTGGGSSRNRNILFAAASLRSAANLLPMACEMAFERENFVHFALMSRSDIDLEDVLEINGIGKHCAIIIHDARADQSMISTKARLTVASARAMFHIHTYMHPQAVLIDGSDVEDNFFVHGIKDQLKATNTPLIQLPARAGHRLAWISKLDSSALAAWDQVHFDILVQAPSSGTGNLRRLLRSLSRADLAGHSTPHLTVELPPTVEAPLEEFLSGFNWPPHYSGSSSTPHMLSLRHRLASKKLSEQESSIRFMESFWPNRPSHTHVLILSPHTEITPHFFHYVKYELLYRKYSVAGFAQDPLNRMLGIGFALPAMYLHAAKAFEAPQLTEASDSDHPGTPFIWQAPNSDAMLILGDKWVELHGYISQVMGRKQTVKLSRQDASYKNPAWLEYVLQLSRLRGYWTVYPSKETASTLIGVHSDLDDVPEEYQGKESKPRPSNEFADKTRDSFDVSSQLSMLNTLPEGGALGDLLRLPVLSWDGKKTDLKSFEEKALDFASQFRKDIGQCSDAEDAPIPDKYARDLFCNSN